MASESYDPEAWNLDEFSTEIDGKPLSGLETLSGFYGLAKRNEQFQEMYTSYRKYHRLMSMGGFRDGNRKVEQAREDFYDGVESYFGLDLDDGELESQALGMISKLSTDEIEALGQNPLSEDQIREMLTD